MFEEVTKTGFSEASWIIWAVGAKSPKHLHKTKKINIGQGFQEC
jgi:hypothetical protein